MWRRIWRSVEDAWRDSNEFLEDNVYSQMRKGLTYVGDAVTSGSLTAKELAEEEAKAAKEAAGLEEERLKAAEAQADAESSQAQEISDIQSGISSGQENAASVTTSSAEDDIDSFISSIEADDEDEDERLSRAFRG